jgi:hypothetical protein
MLHSCDGWFLSWKRVNYSKWVTAVEIETNNMSQLGVVVVGDLTVARQATA